MDVAGVTTRTCYDDQRIAIHICVSGGTETDSRYLVDDNYIVEVPLMTNCSQLTDGNFYYAHDSFCSANNPVQ